MIKVMTDDHRLREQTPDPGFITDLHPSQPYPGHFVIYFTRANPYNDRFWLVSGNALQKVWPYAQWFDTIPQARVVVEIRKDLAIVTHDFVAFGLWVHGGIEDPEMIASSRNFWALHTVGSHWAEEISSFSDPDADDVIYMRGEMSKFKKSQSGYLEGIRA